MPGPAPSCGRDRTGPETPILTFPRWGKGLVVATRQSLTYLLMGEDSGGFLSAPKGEGDPAQGRIGIPGRRPIAAVYYVPILTFSHDGNGPVPSPDGGESESRP
jgi:hypothetical protein